MIRLLLWIAFLASVGPKAWAHEIRPALLEIRMDNSVCNIRWKQPTVGEMSIRLVPRMSRGWIDSSPAHHRVGSGQITMEWNQGNCSVTALEEQTVTIEGLDASITDVFVRVDFNDGRLLQKVLHPGDPPLRLSTPVTPSYPTKAYFLLGASHILEGADHLAFVLGLLLLVGFRKRILVAITGFTVAHSVTLGATSLGLLHPWTALIEVLVALSILFVAAEVCRSDRGGTSLTIRWPELTALGFGLLHGFAFAGALAEIGLPKAEMLGALLLFNLGVEAGQILFVCMVLAVAQAIRLFPWKAHWSRTLPSYAIGSFAGFLVIERMIVLFA